MSGKGLPRARKRRPREQPVVFSYHDYREFLRAWTKFVKNEEGSRLSLRKIAAKAGMSVAYLSMVLAGTRNFSEEALKNFLPLLSLREDEERYFRLLRVVADSEASAERLQALEALQKFSSYKEFNRRELEAYRYLTHWYYVAIREMASFPDFQLDPLWIRRRLKYFVSTAEISEALEFLREFKFIEVHPDGRVSVPKKQMDCFGGVYKIALAQFQRQMFSLASDAIDLTPRTQRNITFHTMPFSTTRFEEIRRILDRAQSDLAALADTESKPDCVYHVSFLGFPLTEVETKEPEEK